VHISEFQQMMKKVYFQKDFDRGVKANFDWLVDEVQELGEAIEGTNLKEIEKEFADVLAWLASLANLLGINLESAALDKYPNKCPKCQQSPCNCPA